MVESEIEESLLGLMYSQSRKEERQRKSQAASRKRIRKRLENAAREALAKYRQDSGKAKPEALDKIRETIHPWWLRLEASGLAKEIATWMRKKKLNLFPVSAPINHYWPRGLIGSLQIVSGLENKPFEYSARFIAEYKSIGRIEADLESSTARFYTENWVGTFGHLFNEERSGLTLWRWPPNGGGCGFKASNYSAHLSFDQPDRFLDQVNPIVVVRFAEQIQDGRVWKVIEKSIKGR